MNYRQLIKVSKPVRYIDREINSVKKDPEGLYRFCLAFPDVYELGMSHIGFKMLYERLNTLDSTYCERFLMPWEDAVQEFGSEVFTSLETYTPLKEFDIIGFSFQYELSLTNVLQSLKLSGIPYKSAERTDDDPVIIAGGSCCVNPAPMSPFIDAFFIGEMEGELNTVVDRCAEIKKEGGSRSDVIAYLNTLPYTYVPALDDKKQVQRQIYMGFSEDVTIDRLVVPSMPVTQDRVAVEISRGCTRGCRFCQAGMIYRPARERDVEQIAKDALNQLEQTGYEEVSLLSLSAADYSCLEPMLVHMAKLLKNRKVSLSLPSLRADKINDFIFRELSRVRKSGFTIAPEAGSERLRRVINKNLTEEEIINAVIKAKEAGWNGAKLYFMIGLPTETDEDVKGIAELAAKVKYAVGKGRFNVRVSVSNFVPKPHTPFQWGGMDSDENLRRKRSIIYDALKPHRIQSSFHDIGQSLMEAALSRGTAEMSKVLEVLTEEGAMFDAWNEHFSYYTWLSAFEKAGVDLKTQVHQDYDFEKPLPWENINSGVSHSFLKKEYDKALVEAETEDCKTGKCTACGVCDFKEIKNVFAKDTEIAGETESEEIKATQFRINFSKTKRQSLLSALETTRIFMHAFRIAEVELAYTKGFNPGPKIRYQLPPPAGAECLDEILFFEAVAESVTKDLAERMNNILPEGFHIESIVKDERKLNKYHTVIEYVLGVSETELFKNSLADGSAFYMRKDKKGRDKKVELDTFLVSFEGNKLIIIFKNLGLFNPLEFFNSKGLDPAEVEITRERVYLQHIDE